MSDCPNFDSVVTRLVTAGTGPQEVEGDAGRVKMYPIIDLIMAANYLAGICAATSQRRGLRFNSLIPDGAVHGFISESERVWNGGGRPF